MDMALEVATERLDVDITAEAGYRVVHVTPPGSHCSIVFDTGVTGAAPASGRGLHLTVTDIEQTVAELIDRGITVDGQEVTQRAPGR